MPRYSFNIFLYDEAVTAKVSNGYVDILDENGNELCCFFCDQAYAERLAAGINSAALTNEDAEAEVNKILDDEIPF